jgi:hypothetical protein
MGWRAGFGEVDITPALGRVTKGRLRADSSTIDRTWIPLTARVMIVEDGTTRCAIVALDLVVLTRYSADRLRAVVAEVAAIEPSHVLINCSHTHNGPGTFSGWAVSEPDLEFLKGLELQLARAVRMALGDVGPVELVAGASQTTGLTFNRRPVYQGEEVGTHGPRGASDFVRVEGPADGELQILLARRPDGTVAGGLANFACHPTMMISEPVLSADFVGAFVNALAERHGGVFLFLQGASGNLHWSEKSFWGEDPEVAPSRSADPAPWGTPEVAAWGAVDSIARRTEAMLAASDDALAGATTVGGEIRAVVREIELAQRKPTAEQIDLAFWYLAQEPGSVDDDEHNRKATGHRYTFYGNEVMQAEFARAVIDLHGWQRQTLPAKVIERPEIIVLALGDVAFVGYPGEMFSEFGLATKAASPFAFTVVCGLTNGWYSYIPTREAFERGGYETRLSTTSRLEVDAGDKMTATGIELLEVIFSETADVPRTG